ncbi:MAG: coproporphyrinogen III oxidase family protein [Syntrophales bacterium]|nr:coproporphyrinogen III oxidase family protein [Syntrophales bacterium]
MNITDNIIQSVVRKQFSRAMRFDVGESPSLPLPENPKPRLLYLHIPFCEQLCPYCSFHRVPFEPSLTKEYYRALIKEMHLYREMGYDFTGIYVGGGTPTVMIEGLVSVLSSARALFGIREISVETNPNHLSEENVRLLVEAGVNRLSVGVQSFDDGLLVRMDRFEKYGSGKEIASRLRSVQGAFQTLNADMMFNFPTQTEDILQWDLEMLKKLSLDQITYYPLMVSSSTRRLISNTLGKTSFHREADYYRLIVDNLTHDYNFSSAWCFSKKRSMIDEYIVDYDEYAGLGSGSIGYLNGVCYANTFNITEYISRLEKGELPLMASRSFNERDRIRYDFLMQLFSTRLYRRRLKGKYGKRWWQAIVFPFLVFFVTGRIRQQGQWWELTPRGCYTWVVMMREFFTAVNNFRDYCRKGI